MPVEILLLFVCLRYLKGISGINIPLNEGGDPNDDHDENQQPRRMDGDLC